VADLSVSIQLFSGYPGTIAGYASNPHGIKMSQDHHFSQWFYLTAKLALKSNFRSGMKFSLICLFWHLLFLLYYCLPPTAYYFTIISFIYTRQPFAKIRLLTLYELDFITLNHIRIFYVVIIFVLRIYPALKSSVFI
jgi:hypothetical protein